MRRTVMLVKKSFGHTIGMMLGLVLSTSVSAQSPPGHTWYISDDQGWSGWMQREGTTGTMWDRPTVSFNGTLKKQDEQNRRTEMEVYLSKKGKLFMIRNDRTQREAVPSITCIYYGFTDYAPNENLLAEKYVETTDIGGTFMCSGMNAFGSWTGQIQNSVPVPPK